MRRTGDLPDLPTAGQLLELWKLAERFESAIRRSPYDYLTGAWQASELLPPDDPGRVEKSEPLAKRRRAGLLYEGELPTFSLPVDRVENERRHRTALQARFQEALRSNAAYRQLHSLPAFRELLKSFQTAQRMTPADGRLNAPDAYAMFIQAVASSLAMFRGGRMKVANAEVRERAAKLIDKLLELREEGVSPPFIGAVSQPSGGARVASLADELDRWRKELRSPLPPDRRRNERNDAFVRHRFAMKVFRDYVGRDSGSLRLADSLAEHFAALIGYKNPAAQVSR